jgi:hypothetical protein
MSVVAPLLGGRQTLGELPEIDAHDPKPSFGRHLLRYERCRNDRRFFSKFDKAAWQCIALEALLAFDARRGRFLRRAIE